MKKILLLISFLYSFHSFSQSQIQVNITDLLANKPLGSVEVYIESNGEKPTFVVSDKFGVAIFKNLQASKSYRIFTFPNDKYAEAFIGNVMPIEGETKVYNLELPTQRIELLEEVRITNSKRAKMNTQNAEVSYIIPKEEIQALPVEGRDITRTLIRLPNLTVATLGYAEAPNVSINGLGGTFTNYLIDGMDNNERFLGNAKFNTPIGFADGISVLTNNYSVEFGNTSNGLVNVTTRSGTNKLTGEAFYLTRPGSIIDSKSPFATLDLSGNQVKDGFQRNQAGFGLGGALKKDKTFFYINFEQTIDKKDNLLNVPQLGINETVTGYNNFSYTSAKIDQVWSKRFKSSLRLNQGVFDIDRQGGGLEGGTLFPSAASAQKNRTYLIALKNAYVLSSYLTGETNFQTSYFRWNYREPNNLTSPSVTVQDPSGSVIAILGQSGSIFDDKEYTNQIQQKLFYRRGKHSLKYGLEFITSDFSLLGGGNTFGTYTVRLNQGQLDALKAKGVTTALNVSDIPSDVRVINYDVELQPNTFGARQNVFSTYLEDIFAVNNKLNLTMGVRYDYDNLTKGGGSKGDLNNLAPRLAFNYSIDDKNTLRGGYGIFTDKIKYSIYSDALQFSSISADFKKQLQELQRLGKLDPNADLDKITFPGNIRATASNVTFLNGPSYTDLQPRRESQFVNNMRILNPNGFQNPYSHQVSLGYQHKQDVDHLFSLDLNYVATNNLYYIRNINAPSAYPLDDPKNVVVRKVSEADLTRPVPLRSDSKGQYAVVGADTLRGFARNVFMNQTDGKARYWAMNVVYQKLKGEDKYAYRMSYSLALIKSNTSSINTRANDSNNYDAEYTYDENDRRHVASAMFFWYPIKNLIISPALLIQSGQPITRIADARIYGTTDLNGDNDFFNPGDYSPGNKRNSDRLPWANTLDLSVKYTLMRHFELSADIFNLLNAVNYSGFNVTRGSSNQFMVGDKSTNTYTWKAASAPRQFQFGARYVF
ncbi:TonB-dependent receptor [Lacihabitans sp. LS3-19]|uniref:TonB-dependent receptor plug domain-containing protein n=1 Tax=Lacihabitans sp. LS3-19 TaxID=2487335 RepID=UPI0020CDA8AF|nr:TonB-dependent receptor [Lacihabitans sp. LS3-19]MCP9768267.1 TonB-dependent receptor [Lacihabitans sp. LS3-19]